MYLFYFVFFILGLIVGSFLNVVIHRTLKNESIIFPRSYCPNCLTTLKYYDLIPLFSFIFLKGTCRYCKKPISLTYPVVELTTGLLFVWSFYSFNFSLQILEFIFLGCVLIALSVIDFKELILPDNLVFITLLGGIIFKVFYWIYYKNPQFIYKAIIGGIFAFLFFYIIFLLFPEGMGGGDVKLSFVLGFYTGFPYVVMWLFLSFFLGSIGGIFYLIFLKKKIKEPLPFGPFLALSSLVTMAWGLNIFNFYFNLFWK